MIKNITLSADDRLIHKARTKAKQNQTSLNQEFRKWLKQYTQQESTITQLQDFKNKTQYVRLGIKFSRDNINER